MLTPVLQSMYITLAGIKQGVIMVRDKATCVQSYYFEPYKWFLLQTDCDKNKNECQHDAGRVAIVNAMNHYKKKNINVDNLFKVFASINGTGVNTAYTTIMCAASPGIYATWIRKN
ncbi:N-acylethanolamine-hydrolyzing acid amidase-like [Aquarana catesbeiana]|uniref:N-acylethanolamine-hydrolyzing acid amidase-like n=1 Tax=Aquarana catesbeiana TaxID=8400 RepID=UPI003CC940CC